MIIGGLDVGTTGCKIILYNDKAELLNTYYCEYDAVHKNGQHEINFLDVKNGVLSLLKSATSEYKIDALGVTSFGETFALLDENDNIIAPSMLYTDPRGGDECNELCEKIGKDTLTLLTGVEPHPMYSISKIMWHKNHTKGFENCKKILLGEDFIVYSLTGVAQIDYSLAARTAAFDIENKCFIKSVFDAANVDISLMSKPVPTGSIAGKTTKAINEILNIDYSIIVVNACHDQVAGMIGSGVFNNDQAMDGTGTVECIPVVLNNKPKDITFYKGGYSVVPYIGDKFACYALSFTGGATLKWFKDNFAEFEYENAKNNNQNIYANLDKLAPQKPTGILVLPHFAGAATPYMDNTSKAAFIGVTLETTKFDLYKALMEGTSYEMLLNFNTMKAQTGEINEIRATGGGATSDIWLQIKADILNTEITALSCNEIGAAGSAALAGVSIGAFANLQETVNKMVKVRKIFTPNPENYKTYSEYYKKYANLYNAIKGL